MHWILRFCPVTVAVLALSGCSGSQKPVAVHPVSGQILYGGEPAKGVRVYLLPTSAPMMPEVPNNPYGVTDAEGRFKLTTFTQGDGAAEGGYQIVLNWPEERKEGERSEADTDRLLDWYGGVRSKLTAQIQPGQNTLPVIDLPAVTQPPQAVNGIPGRN